MFKKLLFMVKKNKEGKQFSKLLKKCFITGWSKTFICKAREIMRNEAYFPVRRNDER